MSTPSTTRPSGGKTPNVQHSPLLSLYDHLYSFNCSYQLSLHSFTACATFWPLAGQSHTLYSTNIKSFHVLFSCSIDP
ncbi:hypothetical protein CW304_08360 [Bacillus sp. UFRGS-B20]|nr:hypothetical protein CW304_08360 [Bacillus sp. UFRGS-B20]